jgi:hypothetical protein
VVMFWVAILAVSILLYVLLDGFDLGVGILFGLAGSEERRRAMMSAVAPIWDGNETWLVVAGVVLWGAFPVTYATLLSAFYLPIILMLAGLILRGVAFEYRSKTERLRWIWDASFGAELGDRIGRKPLLPIPFRRIRDEPRAGKVAGDIAQHALLVGEPHGDPLPRLAVTSISIFIRGSTRPQIKAVAAGRIAPNTSPKTGTIAGQSAGSGT